MKHEQLKTFREALRTEKKRSELQELCRELLASGIDYNDIAPVIWDIIVEKTDAETSWLPAASIVNHTDAFWHVAIQRPEDKHKHIWFGEPWPEFRRVEAPLPLAGTLEELQARLPEVAATHDWLLTERCLLGIAEQSDAKTILQCIAEYLLPTKSHVMTGPWWSDTRITTVRCMVDAWKRYGDEAVIPIACRYGARLCAKTTRETDEQKRSMNLAAKEYEKLGTREPNKSNPSFDEMAFREQLSSADLASAFGAITQAWQKGTSLEQIELAMTMNCVDRLLRASHGDGAKWASLKIELMATANITRLKPLGETLAIKSAYPAAYLVLYHGENGLAEAIPGIEPEVNDEAFTNDNLIAEIINAIRAGNPSIATPIADRYACAGGDGLELLRCMFATLGHDNSTAGQRCMIEAWHLAKKASHPARNRILSAIVGWEASYRKPCGTATAPPRPAKGPAQVLAEDNSEANVFSDSFEGTELSDQWRSRSELFGELREIGRPMRHHASVVVENGLLRFAPLSSKQLVTLRQNFSDFVLTVDLRIICHLAGIIVRWNSPREYYMVQVGIPWGDQAAGKVGGWHAFSPIHGGMDRENMMRGTRLIENKWYRFRLKAEGFHFKLSVHALNDNNSTGQTMIDALEWEDTDKLFTSGAIGFWECSETNKLGEQAEFRNLNVQPLNK